VRERSSDPLETDFPDAPRSSGTPEEGGGSIAHLRLLWVHRGLVCRATLGAMLASALAAFLIPARYQSTARLMPPDNSNASGLALQLASLSGSAGGLGGIANEMLGLKSTSDVFVGILTSRTAEDNLIRQFDLQKLYRDRRMQDARQDLAEHTEISVDRKSQIISVSVTDGSPQRAAAMAQAYVAELNRLVADLSTSSARRERLFLEDRLKTVNRDLESAEKQFSQFASQNAAIDIKEQGKAMVEAAATLQGERIAAQSEYEGLKQIYSDQNVRVRSSKARIDELQNQLDKLGGKNETATAVSPASGPALYPSLRKLPLLGVAYADLYRETMIQEAVLETLTKEYEMAKIEEAKEIPTVKVLDVAEIPDKKTFPPRLLILFLGTAFGVAGASAWIFGQTLWRETGANHPGKMFAQEVFSTLSLRLPVWARSGSGKDAGKARASGWIGLRWRHRTGPSK
jgi:uncharacterized protein involved in exopolysaccharide biosynthesis